MSNWHPPCNTRWGTPQEVSDGEAIVCDGMPGHSFVHFNKSHGIRWRVGGRVGRCRWVACTAPDRVRVDGRTEVHLCPGGIAEQRYRP